MSARKSAEQKKRTGSKQNLPRTYQTAADQLTLTPPDGIPQFPALIATNEKFVRAREIYCSLGNALLKYQQLHQQIDSLTMQQACISYMMYEQCLEIASDPEQCFVHEAKSHTSSGEMTLKEHPAVKMMRDSMTDFQKCLKSLGLDVKGRSTILVQLSMVGAMHGNSNSHPANKFFMRVG